MDESIKRWTAKHKTGLMIEIIQGKAPVSEASRSLDLIPSEIEGWVDNAKGVNPLEIARAIRETVQRLSESLRRGHARVVCTKKFRPRWMRRTGIEPLHPAGHLGRRHCCVYRQAMRVVRHSSAGGYYEPVKAAPKVDPRFFGPIKKMIEETPSFGYRSVAWLLGFNKNTLQRIFHLQGWQIRKRAVGMRPRIHRHLFESSQHAMCVHWLLDRLLQQPPPHQALAMRTPVGAFTLKAWP
ncbi:hypothetical protein [Pseudooceanicola sp. HF7]|uniref:hypothetical protein n=1 Tax=Pseudooceanicola sp. HF7 TaxID=2721560 RepID=UPI0020CA95B7|nr:hypothetical protein [Pseudooceanicola sp. HF7]